MFTISSSIKHFCKKITATIFKKQMAGHHGRDSHREKFFLGFDFSTQQVSSFLVFLDYLEVEL